MGCIPKLLFDGFDKLLRLGFTSYLFKVQIKRDFSMTISLR